MQSENGLNQEAKNDQAFHQLDKFYGRKEDSVEEWAQETRKKLEQDGIHPRMWVWLATRTFAGPAKLWYAALSREAGSKGGNEMAKSGKPGAWDGLIAALNNRTADEIEWFEAEAEANK